MSCTMCGRAATATPSHTMTDGRPVFRVSCTACGHAEHRAA